MSNTFKKTLLVAGDLAAFVAALLASIALRYPERLHDPELWSIHFRPFAALFFLWLVVFYMYNLYDLRSGEHAMGFFSAAWQAFAANALLAVAFFYFNPYVGITPRTVLFIDLAFSASLFAAWRIVFHRTISHKLAVSVALAGIHPAMLALAQELAQRPALGYRVACFIADDAASPFIDEAPLKNKFPGFGYRFAPDSAFPIERNLRRSTVYGEDSAIEGKVEDGVKMEARQGGYFLTGPERSVSSDLANIPVYALGKFRNQTEALQVNLVILGEHVTNTAAKTLSFFSLLPQRMSFYTLPSFIERVFQKVPLSEVSESWFLENLSEGEKQFHETAKRMLDIAGTICVGILAAPLIGLAALLIKLEDGRNAFYRQQRIGRSGKPFSLLKLQTMREDAEAEGPRWTTKDDPRVTRFGVFLRSTRLDELPQLWNVLRGDLSFVGPRPERPEFVKNLEKEIPFYTLRHLVRPGLSGWAQINNPLHSVAESYEKLEYDLFYIKNSSLALDMAIALKTLSIILRRKGR